MKPNILSTARLSLPLATALAALYASQSARAQDGTWTQTAAGPFNWDDIANWDSGVGPIADGADFTASFVADITAAQTVNLNNAKTIGNITFNDATGSHNLTISGANILTLDVASGSPVIDVIQGGRTLTISSVIAGNDGLAKAGAGVLSLNGANTYTGDTTISGGTLVLNNATALGGSTPGVDGTSAISMANNTTLQSNFAPLIDSNSFVYAPIDLTGGTAKFLIGAGDGGNPQPVENAIFNINGAIGGLSSTSVTFGNTTGNLDNANSIISLGAASNYTGNTTIAAGGQFNRINLRAGVENALPTTTVLTFDNVVGAGSGRISQFDLNGNNQTLSGLTQPANIPNDRQYRVNNSSASAATLTIDNTGDFTFGGAKIDTGTSSPGNTTSALIVGNISLVKSGAGTFTLGGNLTDGATAQSHAYTGATTINGGTLRLGPNGIIGSSSGITIEGSTAKLLQESATPLAPAVTLTQGTLTGSGTVNTVTVGNGTGGIVSNNNGVAGAALTVGTLTFDGTATVNTHNDTAAAAIVTTDLTTNVAGTVTINPSVPPFVAGAYDLISYGGGSILGGGFGQFVLGTITGASQRQTTAFADSSTAITLTLGADNPPYWVGDGDGNWNASSPDNWRFVSDNSPTSYLEKDNVVFNDLATPLGTITVNIDPASVSPSSTTFDNSTKDYVLNGSGASGIATGILTKNGTGSLTLNSANTYTGATAINGGTLSLGSGGASGSLSPASPITVASGATFAVNQSDTVTQGADFGAISGDGGFAQNGGGTTELNLVNTFTGPTSITGGTLQVGAAGRLGGGTYAGDIAISSGAAFEYSGTASQTLSGIISGQGALVKGSSSALTLSGPNTYQGSTTVNAGRLDLADVGALGSTSSISMADGTTLRPTIDGVVINSNITLGGSGTTAQINAPFTASAGGTLETLTLSNPITGTGNLRLFGSTSDFNTNATILLNAQSTYSGDTELDTDGTALHLAGVNLFVKLGVANALPTGTVLTLDGNVGRGSGRTVSLDLNGFNQELAGLAAVTTHVARNQRVNNTSATLATLTINSISDSAYGGAGPSSTFGGSPVNPTAKIVGNLALTKTGAAKFTLLGSHEYTGDTTVTQGTLSQEAPNTVNEASTVSIASDAFLNLDFDETDGPVTDTVDKLFIGAVQQPAGVYIATDNVTDSGTPIAQITGPGTLTVTSGPVGSGYAAWAGTNADGEGAELDFDKDGVANGVEFFMNAAAGFTSNPQLDASNTITWPNGGNIPASAYGTQFVVQTSSDLAIWADVLVGDLAANTDGPGGSLTYTLTGGAPRFVRLKVTPD